MDLFQLKPLPGVDDIRILTLLPGKQEDPLQVEICVASVYDDLDYAALSYCWGPPDSPVTAIICNDLLLYVRDNLHDALTTFRSPTESLRLWVDAICINQKDEAEKSLQVPKMGRIYRRASKVLIWLGRLDKSMRRVFDIAMDCTSVANPGLIGYSKAARQLSVSGCLHQYSARKAFERILDRPWFRRVWIVQELALSGDRAYILLDRPRDLLRWERFIHFLRGLDYRAYKFETHRFIIAIDSMRLKLAAASFERERYPPLLELLIQFQDFKATEPQDKVYALMAIAKPDRAWQSITIDYTLGPTEVFKMVTLAYLAVDLRALSIPMEIFSRQNGRLDSSPTWVIDWYHLSYREDGDARLVTQPLIELFGGAILPKAWEEDCGNASLKLSPDSTALIVSGTVVDTLDEISVSPDPDDYRHIVVPTSLPNDWRTRRWWQFQRVTFTTFFLFDALARPGAYPVYAPTGESLATVLGHIFLRRFQYEDTEASQDAFCHWHAQLKLLRFLMIRLGLCRPQGRSLAFWIVWVACGSLSIPNLLKKLTVRKGMREHQLMVYRYVQGTARRRLARTKEGLLGSVPRNARAGDLVLVCQGASTPLILRQDEEKYQLVGDAYIRGLHDQQSIDEKLAEGCKEIHLT